MLVRKQQRTIDLGVLRDNIRTLKSKIPDGTLLLAVVKADAYGHGAVQVAVNALAAGASWLAVAIPEEGIELREAGIDAPILVLGATTPAAAEAGVAYGLTMAVCDADMVGMMAAEAEKQHKTACVHLKLDTGMGRIGARTEAEVQAVLQAVQTAPQVRLTGVFTHFADADGATADYTGMQFEKFLQLSAPVPPEALRHCANSAAIHRYPEMAMDMVRAGITMYGYPPVETEDCVRPFMTWTTEVTYVKEIESGETVSYGRIWAADGKRRIATIACGYGDGYLRTATGKAQALVRGVKVPVVGRICMDQMILDVTDVPGVCAGDIVTLMGQDGDEKITAEDIAAWAGTISYEVLLEATGRVKRVWLHDCREEK